MLLEAALAVMVGALALWIMLEPVVRPHRVTQPPDEPLDPEETPKGVALTALKEIEFDRATGKLSDADYEQLKARYTAAAVDALRAETASGASGDLQADDIEAMIAGRVRSLHFADTSTPRPPECPTCGPRPEPDAVFCSSCGFRLEAPDTCPRCGSSLSADSRFCESCGVRVAA
jgi:hypothetical protein